MDQNWQLKKQLSSDISNSYIESIYQKAIDLGAMRKAARAGSGGFMMILAPKTNILKAIGLYQLNFNFDSSGAGLLIMINQR